MDNHFHLLVRTGKRSLAECMRKLLTGYVVNFNRRHKRYGHLFQNRYKSILCEEDPYLLELTRYIHLNPLRARVVNSLKELAQYPWCGHGVVIDAQEREWQDVESVLAYFGKRRGKAIAEYENYVKAGIPLGRRPELVGGGLIRSLGGWSQVLAERRRGEKSASDQRVLGSGDFIEKVWTEAEKKAKETLRGRGKILNLGELLKQISREEKIGAEETRAGGRQGRVVKARRRFSRIAVRELGYSGAEVARFLGVATATVNRYASVPINNA